MRSSILVTLLSILIETCAPFYAAGAPVSCEASYAQSSPAQARIASLLQIENDLSTPKSGWKIRLDRLLEARQAHLLAKHRTAKDISRINGAVDHEPGTLSRVLSARDSTGDDFALKLHYTSDLEENAVGLILQNTLGEMGVAPKLEGLLDESETQKLLRRFPSLSRLKAEYFDLMDKTPTPPRHAVLMQMVDDAWNCKILYRDEDAPLPAFSKNWDLKAIQAQFQAIERILNKLQIHAFDPQFLIDRDGRVYLIDLDFYGYVDQKKRIWRGAGLRKAFQEPEIDPNDQQPNRVASEFFLVKERLEKEARKKSK